MAETKTKPTGKSVDDFIAEVDDERKRDDSRELIRMMERVTGEKAYMWGPSIIGFGNYHYVYDSGHEGDAPVTGFSPRKASLTLYVMAGFDGLDDLLARLGKHKASKGCLYIKRLSDIDMTVLEEITAKSVAWTREKYPG